MLKDDFYTLTRIEDQGDAWQATITLNTGHPIFNGHFPQTPVVPGVCMMQITREVAEDIIGEKLDIKEAGSMKFMSMVNPLEDSQMDMRISIQELESGFRVQNIMKQADRVCLKFKGLMTRQSLN